MTLLHQETVLPTVKNLNPEGWLPFLVLKEADFATFKAL